MIYCISLYGWFGFSLISAKRTRQQDSWLIKESLREKTFIFIIIHSNFLFFNRAWMYCTLSTIKTWWCLSGRHNFNLNNLNNTFFIPYKNGWLGTTYFFLPVLDESCSEIPSQFHIWRQWYEWRWFSNSSKDSSFWILLNDSVVVICYSECVMDDFLWNELSNTISILMTIV
jgi:hypothetical protein